jgi:AraC-like DNA-binding protein
LQVKRTREPSLAPANGAIAPRRDLGADKLSPAPDLALFVAYHWVTRWNLEPGDTHQVKILGDPAVHLVFERGASRVVGVYRGLFTHKLEGTGRVVASKFHPGAFRAVFHRDVASLTDRRVPLHEVFKVNTAELEQRVLDVDEEQGIVAIEHFLRSLGPQETPELRLAVAMVERIAHEPELTSVEQLASNFGLGVRRVQRLFREHVGASPKWVIRRCRLREAAAEMGKLAPRRLASFAAALGYFDQAHFTRDFKAVTGFTPSEFAANHRAR